MNSSMGRREFLGVRRRGLGRLMWGALWVAGAVFSSPHRGAAGGRWGDQVADV